MKGNVIYDLYPENPLMSESSRNPSDYYFESEVFNGPIDLDEIRTIEKKLSAYAKYYSDCKANGNQFPDRSIGLTPEEVSKYLDWIVYRSRLNFTQNSTANARTYDFAGCCNPSQQLITGILDKVIGPENVHPFNTANIISHPDPEILQRNYSTASKHCATIATFPILDETGIARDTDILIDATFRQFCIANDCSVSKYDTTNNPYTNKPAPAPGFFLMESYDGAVLADTLVSRGYHSFDEQTAKLYGDAFSKSSISAESLDFLDDNIYRPFDLTEITQYTQEYLDQETNKYEFETLTTDSSFVKAPGDYTNFAKTKEMNRDKNIGIRDGFDATLEEFETRNQTFGSKIKALFDRLRGQKSQQLPEFRMPPSSQQPFTPQQSYAEKLQQQAQSVTAYQQQQQPLQTQNDYEIDRL